MSGPLFVVELFSGEWISRPNWRTMDFAFAKRYPSEQSAMAALLHERRWFAFKKAKIVRVDEGNPCDNDADARNQEGAEKFS